MSVEAPARDQQRASSKANAKDKALIAVYEQADMYDYVYRGWEGDLDFYCNRAKKGKVLYLGIGTGRIYGSLMRINSEAFGLEYSEKMIENFLRKFPEANEKIIHENALEMNSINETFDTIIAPYAFLNTFSADENKILLENISKLLKPDGVFCSDVFSPFTNPHFSESSEETVFIVDGARVKIRLIYNYVQQEVFEYSEIQLSNGDINNVYLKNHFYYPNELERMLSEFFSVKKIQGGFNGEILSPDNEIIYFEGVKEF